MTPCVDDGRPIAELYIAVSTAVSTVLILENKSLVGLHGKCNLICFFGRFKTLNTLATFFPIRLFVGSRSLQTFSEKAFILITLTSVAAFFHTFEMA